MDNIINLSDENNIYLNNKKIKNLIKLKRKNESIILDNDTKIKEKKRINDEIKELNLVKKHLEFNTEKKILEALNLNKYDNDNKATLNALRDFKLKIDQPTSLYKIYVDDLLNANLIDFSLFYFGNQKDILNIIFDSFIDFKSDYPIQLKYDTTMSDEQKIDFINLGIKYKIYIPNVINYKEIELLYKNIGISPGIPQTIDRKIYKDNELLEYLFYDIFSKSNNINESKKEFEKEFEKIFVLERDFELKSDEGVNKKHKQQSPDRQSPKRRTPKRRSPATGSSATATRSRSPKRQTPKQRAAFERHADRDHQAADQAAAQGADQAAAQGAAHTVSRRSPRRAARATASRRRGGNGNIIQPGGNPHNIPTNIMFHWSDDAENELYYKQIHCLITFNDDLSTLEECEFLNKYYQNQKGILYDTYKEYGKIETNDDKKQANIVKKERLLNESKKELERLKSEKSSLEDNVGKMKTLANEKRNIQAQAERAVSTAVGSTPINKNDVRKAKKELKTATTASKTANNKFKKVQEGLKLVQTKLKHASARVKETERDVVTAKERIGTQNILKALDSTLLLDDSNSCPIKNIVCIRTSEYMSIQSILASNDFFKNQFFHKTNKLIPQICKDDYDPIECPKIVIELYAKFTWTCRDCGVKYHTIDKPSLTSDERIKLGDSKKCNSVDQKCMKATFDFEFEQDDKNYFEEQLKGIMEFATTKKANKTNYNFILYCSNDHIKKQVIEVLKTKYDQELVHNNVTQLLLGTPDTPNTLEKHFYNIYYKLITHEKLYDGDWTHALFPAITNENIKYNFINHDEEYVRQFVSNPTLSHMINLYLNMFKNKLSKSIITNTTSKYDMFKEFCFVYLTYCLKTYDVMTNKQKEIVGTIIDIIVLDSEKQLNSTPKKRIISWFAHIKTIDGKFKNIKEGKHGHYLIKYFNDLDELYTKILDQSIIREKERDQKQFNNEIIEVNNIIFADMAEMFYGLEKHIDFNNLSITSDEEKTLVKSSNAFKRIWNKYQKQPPSIQKQIKEYFKEVLDTPYFRKIKTDYERLQALLKIEIPDYEPQETYVSGRIIVDNLTTDQKEILIQFFNKYFDKSIIEFEESDLKKYTHLNKYFLKKKYSIHLKVLLLPQLSIKN